MKRIVALLLCIGLFAAVAAGCGGGKQITATGDEAANTDLSAYKNTYDDLLVYFSALGYINPLKDNENTTYTVMQANLIGAKQGRRFVAQHTKNATIELYEFDPAAKNATADEVLKSVKDTNSFTNLVGEQTENAYLSTHQKYLMIYNDASITKDTKETDENYVKRSEVIEKFMAFDR